jgi:hypothetical protein
MTISDALCQRLRGDAGVSAFVGTRVYQLKLPQQPTLPALRVQLVSEPTTYHLRGPVNAWQALVQVDAYASEFDPAFPDPYDQVERLATAVEQALSGVLATVGPIAIIGCFRVSRAPLYEPGELRLARILQEYRCTYHDATVAVSKTRRTEDLKTQKEQRPHG